MFIKNKNRMYKSFTLQTQWIPVLGLFSLTLAAAASEVDYATVTSSTEEAVSHDYETQKSNPVPVYRQIEYGQIAPAAYDFNYEVHDEHTGDIKSQKEVRNGDAVQGRYELIDSDGYRRIVEYTADSHTGFNAIVRREPVDIKIPQPIPQDARLSYTAPVIKDIPVQARPVNRDIVHIVPKSSAQPKTSQYYVTPTYATTSHLSSNPGVSTPSAPAYRSLTYSAASADSEHLGGVSQVSGRKPSDYTTYLYSPVAYNGQANSERPPQKTRFVLVPKYRTISHSAPVSNAYDYTLPLRPAQVYQDAVQNYGIPLRHAQVYHHAGQNEGYVTGVGIKGYKTIPVQSYSPPALSGETVYAQYTKAHSKDYAGELANAVSAATGFTPINPVQHIQTNLVAPSLIYPTQTPLVSSVAPRLETTLSSHNSVGTEEHANDNIQRKSIYSLKEGESYGPYDAPTTPSYKQ